MFEQTAIQAVFTAALHPCCCKLQFVVASSSAFFRPSLPQKVSRSTNDSTVGSRFAGLSMFE
ncbi:hypothetical protein CW304_03790 [Bacillus sp. UFRGS-B20]|nr:hypothetical protein CW304_03790 [Bacillus sp. UFRGS-B20]